MRKGGGRERQREREGESEGERARERERERESEGERERERERVRESERETERVRESEREIERDRESLLNIFYILPWIFVILKRQRHVLKKNFPPFLLLCLKFLSLKLSLDKRENISYSSVLSSCRIPMEAYATINCNISTTMSSKTSGRKPESTSTKILNQCPSFCFVLLAQQVDLVTKEYKN